MNRKRLVALLTAAAATAMLLTSCAASPDMYFMGQPVKDAGKTIATFDESIPDFVKMLKVEANIDKEARCYLQLNLETEVGESAKCGPVWRYGDDEPTWVDVPMTANTEGVLFALDNASITYSTATNEGAKLWHPNGKAVPKKPSVVEPEAKNKAKAGELVMGASQYVDLSELSSDGSGRAYLAESAGAAIRTQDFDFGVFGSESKPRMNTVDGRWQTVDKNEFRTVALAIVPIGKKLASEDLLPALSINVDGKKTPVTLDFSKIFRDGSSIDGSFAISVPQDAKKTTLDVEYDGGTQVIDLDTLKRSGVGGAGYMGGQTLMTLSQGANQSLVEVGDGFSIFSNARDGRMLRFPHEVGFGWAKDDRTWVTVSFVIPKNMVGWSDSSPWAGYYKGAVTAADLKLVSSDGAEHVPAGASTFSPVDDGTRVETVFDVAADADGFELAGGLTFAATLDDSVNSAAPGSGTATLPAPSFANMVFGLDAK